MKKTCLTCKYEPDWSEWHNGFGYERRTGKCRWFVEPIVLPESYKITQTTITHYKNDDSGVCANCQTHEEKDAKEIKRADFTKGSYWTMVCPFCSEILEINSDPQHEESVYCDGCKAIIRLVGES